MCERDYVPRLMELYKHKLNAFRFVGNVEKKSGVTSRSDLARRLLTINVIKGDKLGEASSIHQKKKCGLLSQQCQATSVVSDPA